MSKKAIGFIIIVTIFLSLLVNMLAGRYLIAKISTWPVLNKWKLLSPQTPIVITNHETIRVTDSGDVASAVEQAKSKISSLVLVSSTGDAWASGAINLTSDGSFVTTAGSFNGKTTDNYFVLLSDGRKAKVVEKTVDPASQLVFFKANINNIPTASLGNSKNLSVGDKVIFIQNSLQNFTTRANQNFVSQTQGDVSGLVFLADFPKRSFIPGAPSTLLGGQVVINTSGEVAGIWSGNSIISSDVIKTAMTLYFNNPKAIVRPSFGFSYIQIGQNDSSLIGLPQGVLVKDVSANSSAKAAGLALGDVITAVDSQNISETSALETLLEKYHPGDKIILEVYRNSQAIKLNLTVGELK